MARSKTNITRETKGGKPIWRLPNGEVVILEVPTITLGEPRPKSFYGRRARFDCCTDCGASVEVGALWCDNCRKLKHFDVPSRTAEEHHRMILMNDRTLTKPW